MLRDWYQPEHGSVWVEQKVFDKLNHLKLAPEQQSLVDSGIRINQWALGRLQLQQPFNNLRRRLICSINTSRQASTILIANGDQVADHHHKIDQALVKIAQGAFLPVRKGTCSFWIHNPQFSGSWIPVTKVPSFRTLA